MCTQGDTNIVLNSSTSKGGRREWTAVRTSAVSKPLLRAIERVQTGEAWKVRLQDDEARVREQIRTQLQQLAARPQAVLHALRSQVTVVMHLKAPPVFRAQVATDGALAKGPAAAPVTIVEFSDFHCPFCKRVVPTLAQLETQYGDKVKLIFRDFPIDQLHPGARQAHEAARCAQEQGMCWASHDALCAQVSQTSPEQRTASAQEVGLDLPACAPGVSSGRYQTTVQQDIDEGTRAGVTGGGKGVRYEWRFLESNR
jgi:protein-disulfide isomerase